ncbi:MAG: hypothetical protein Q4A90_06710 [Streptococcus sp.]|nr:hypothetical protein [Streptococcus sp.]
MENKTNSSAFDLFIEKNIIGNPIIKTLKRRAILRKFLTFLILISVWLFLLMNAYFSPQRITYTEEQLETTKSFENDSGKIVMTKQVYSKKNGILLLEFETFDYTSSITKGINAKNLTWVLYAKHQDEKTKMDVIPLTDNKIAVIIKELPKNFEAIALNITNETAVNQDLDVDIENYGDSALSDSSESVQVKPKEKKAENQSKEVQFMVVSQGDKLKYSYLKDLSRESFALNAFEDEKEFQVKQINKLNKSIENLTKSIAEDKSTLLDLERSSQYLVGNNLIENQDKIKQVEGDVSNKELKIEQAKDNINSLQNVVDALERSMQSVHDGDYEFNAPITSIEMDF